MTQKERALDILDPLPTLGTVEAIADILEEIVGEAQNEPPDGGSDGSITEEEWYIFRDTARALRTLQSQLEKFLV